MKKKTRKQSNKPKAWSDYLWVGELVYMGLSFFNILFAWLGMIYFFTPLILSFIKRDKGYCNHYCGRGQLFTQLSSRISWGGTRPLPQFLRKRWFRYSFLTFFMIMFSLMIAGTYQVFAGAKLSESITLLWTFKLPWEWSDISFVTPWVAQYAFGFFSVMMTSVLLGIILLSFYRPRSFCVICPMGTMTQGICELRHRKTTNSHARKSQTSS